MSMITKLSAGHYGLMCFIAASDGAPHIAHGIVKVFDVSSSNAWLHTADRRRHPTLTDSAATVPATGLPATGWTKITNNGTTNRDFNVALLNGTTTPAEADAYFGQFFNSGTAPTGTPPQILAGGVIQIPKGATAYMQLTHEGTGSPTQPEQRSRHGSQRGPRRVHRQVATVKE